MTVPCIDLVGGKVSGPLAAAGGDEWRAIILPSIDLVSGRVSGGGLVRPPAMRAAL